MRSTSLRLMVLAAIMTGAMAAVAQIPTFYLPGVPSAPVTLQVLVVFVAAGLLGPRWGALSMLLYIGLGTIGIPVFAGSSTLVTALARGTAGYLFSYPLAACVIGLLAPPNRAGVVRLFLAMVVGLGVIYLGGAGWAALMGGKALWATAQLFVLPFIPLDLGKAVLAVALCTTVQRALRAQGYAIDRTV